MSVTNSIDNLLRKLSRRRLRTPTPKLYAEQVKAKLKNAYFSLEILKELESLTQTVEVQDDTTSTTAVRTPTAQNFLTVEEKVNFYCECFWDFLRSSLDILAQLINELRSLSLDERSVDFKQVANELCSCAKDTPLERAVNNCRRSEAFKTLEEYRHCSMHRRQVYIETKRHTTDISGTRGYDSATSLQRQITFESNLCNNPWDLAPVVDYQRPVVKYCEHLLQAIERRINTIVNRLP